MKPMKVAENILPLGEFKTHASRVLRDLKESNRPIVITQNGKPAAVLMTPEEFDDLNDNARFMRGLNEGLNDIKAGRVHDHDEVMTEMKKRFGGTTKRK